MSEQDKQQQAHTLAGAPKMGWLCSYTPLEILLAAGFQPVRITGHTGAVQKADGLMHPNMCQFVRACLDAAVDGAYSTFEGAVFVNSCDAMRRLADAWRKYTDAKFVHMIDLPKGAGDADAAYLRHEFEKLRRALESAFGIEVSNPVIKQAVKLYNTSRSLYHEMNALRTDAPPRVSGREAWNMAGLFNNTPPAVWNQAMKALLEQKRADAPPAVLARPRVILAGSPAHNPEFAGFVEDCGLDVVFEDMCTGSRFFDVSVGNAADPLLDLARGYLQKPPCARMMTMDKRAEAMIDRARAMGARGVVHHALKFCDTVLYDAPELKRRLEAAGLRTLFLEGDGTLGSMGQLKTRIQAFAEVLGDDL